MCKVTADELHEIVNKPLKTQQELVALWKANLSNLCMFIYNAFIAGNLQGFIS